MVFSSEMVCEKCEKKGKLGKVINPDPWKAGSSNNTMPGSSSGSRKVGENKLLTSKKNRFNPTDSDFKKCRICKQKVRRFQIARTLLYFCFCVSPDTCST